MKRHLWMAALAVVVLAAGRGWGAEPPCCEPASECFLERLAPVGGWNPYGGGLLRWWNACCFRAGTAPDDYCRKPLPRLCWPAYPGWYSWGSPEVCIPPCTGPRNCDKPH